MSYTFFSSWTGQGIRCLLFDLGYTIWNRRHHPDLWQRAERASNLGAVSLLRQHLAGQLPASDDETLGERLRDTFDEHEHDMIRRDPVHEPNGPLAIERTLRDWGIERVAQELCERVFAALNVRLPDSLPLLEDAISTLEALKERGYRLGVVTNSLWGGQPFRDDLRALGLLHYFDERAIAVSADVGVRKPNSQLFWHTLQALQTQPEQAAMVGDALRTDILGAQKLGVMTVWLPRTKQREQVKQYLASLQHTSHPQPASPQGPTSGESGRDASASDTSFYDEDYMPANVQGRDGYLERFLRGEIAPDVIIERVNDLLDVFALRSSHFR